jgi:hypothetical protein
MEEDFSNITEKDIENAISKSFTDRYGFDPFTIIMIVGLIFQAIQIIQQCRMPKSLIRENARREGLAYRRFVKRQIYDKLLEKGIEEEQVTKIVADIKKLFMEKWS